MSNTPIVLPDLPPAPGQGAPWADHMRYSEAVASHAHIRVLERLAAAQERVGDIGEQMLATSPAASSSEGLTAGDVAIVKGIVDAVRPA